MNLLGQSSDALDCSTDRKSRREPIPNEAERIVPMHRAQGAGTVV